MASFRFKAIAANGAVERGVLDAPSAAAVMAKLRSEGKFPVSTEVAAGRALFELPAVRAWLARRGRSRRLAMAIQELASLLGAGVELDRALGIVGGLADIGSLRDAFAAVRARIRDGGSLADAMASDEAFPRFVVSMVRGGEMGGALDLAMQRLADYLQRSLAIREAIVSALFYPAILLVSASVSVSIILFFVLPAFAPMFEEAGRDMPLPARIAMGLSDFARGYWWLVLGLVILGGLVFRRAMREPSFRKRVHAAMLAVPLFGPLLRATEVERLLRSVGASIQSGVALPVSLALARDVLWNEAIADAVGAAAASLREGESLSSRLGQGDVFPAHTLDIVRIGEETGRLGEMLLRQADFDERRIRHAIDRLLGLLVPGLTIALGVVVGGLIAAMLGAILSVNDLALQ